MWELQEACKEFLVESHENLDQLDTDLVDLEKSPDPKEALGRIFRTLHTIKGSCTFLGFPRLEGVAHAGENLLGKLRDGSLALGPAVTAALLRMVDTIRAILKAVEATGTDGDSDHQDLVAALEELSNRPAAPLPAPSLAGMTVTGAVRGVPREKVTEEAAGDGSAVYDASVRINIELLDKLMGIAGEIVLARNQILQYGARHG